MRYPRFTRHIIEHVCHSSKRGPPIFLGGYLLHRQIEQRRAVRRQSTPCSLGTTMRPNATSIYPTSRSVTLSKTTRPSGRPENKPFETAGGSLAAGRSKSLFLRPLSNSFPPRANDLGTGHHSRRRYTTLGEFLFKFSKVVARWLALVSMSACHGLESARRSAMRTRHTPSWASVASTCHLYTEMAGKRHSLGSRRKNRRFPKG